MSRISVHFRYLFKFFHFFWLCCLFQAPILVMADDFSSALQVVLQEARTQKIYYSDLINYLDEDNATIWREGRRGAYQGFPGLLGLQPFSVPSQGILMAQESMIFWETAEFQFEQLIRFYSGLPDGAYQTVPIQNLLLEIIYELSQSATVAFYDLHAHILTLRTHYHSERRRDGYPRDEKIPQSELDFVAEELNSIYRLMKENKGVHPHWNIDQLHNLKKIIANLPASLMADQYYSDFRQSVYLTQFLLQFYLGDPTSLQEVEVASKESIRWVRVISDYFHRSPKFFTVSLFCVRERLSKSDILLEPSEVDKLARELKKSILTRNLSLAFSAKQQICDDLKEKQRLESLRNFDVVPGSALDFHAGIASTSVVASAPAVAASAGSVSDPSSVSGVSLGSSSAEDSSSTQFVPERGVGLYQPVSASALVQSSTSCAQSDSGIARGALGGDLEQGGEPPRGASELVGAAQGAEEETELKCEVEPEPEVFDYLRTLKAEHERYQKLKKERRDALDQPLDQVAPVDLRASSVGGACAQAKEKEIRLSGQALDTYLTAMGKRASRSIRNREVHELVTALGGRLDFTLGDPRIVLPNRNVHASQPEFFCKMHFRHSGRETFPLGTLKAFLGEAIKRAGLDSWVKY